MKLVFTAPALADLDALLAYTAQNYPQSLSSLERRLRAVLQRVRTYPLSARAVEQHADIRTVPLLRYPYRIFYRVRGDRIEILHIHHTARRQWPG